MIMLRHVTVSFGTECRVTRSDGLVEAGRFTLIQCLGDDTVLHGYFLRVAGAMLGAVGDDPAGQDVADAVANLVELFRAMTQPPAKSVQGLWAELLLVAKAGDPVRLTGAWHLLPEERFDFGSADQRIEVKSTALRSRRHHFGLEQLRPNQPADVLVASLYVERAETGASVCELANLVRTRMAAHPDMVLHVDRVIGLTLGSDWRQGLEDRFDTQLAEKSLAFYRATDIPCIPGPLPPSVSDVRFMADLTDVPPVSSEWCRAEGGLFRSVLRR